MNIHKVTSQVGSNPISFETGKIAKLADGAVMVTCGETVVLVTAVSATKVKAGQTWFPLSVEYKEKASAAGQFPGGYFKREGRPTEKEILTISDIPFAGPIGAVRVGRVDGEFVINPVFEDREQSDLDLIYVGNKTDVIMIEGAANQLPEEDFIKALHFAQAAVQKLVEAQEELVRLAGKPKRDYTLTVAKEELLEVGYEIAGSRIEDAIYAPTKMERARKVGALRDEVEAAIKARYPESTDFDVEQVFEYIQKKAFRISIMEKGLRADGRQIGDLRPLFAEANSLPRVHGSAIFARGETQAMGLCTLAPADEKQFFDNYAGGEDSKRFILHYNFPPFSVGECGRMGGINRREIGHGALAERSIAPVIPDVEDFPYAMRVSSEVMESNGSTSMATVCAGTMSLLCAGVPLKAPVGGISVGLVTDWNEDGTLKSHKALLDIIGSEDFYGDMDFKLCGTDSGVTGYQLDLKLPGLPMAILEEAIHMAKAARTTIIAKMTEAVSGPQDLSPHAPRIVSVKIPADRIGELIGPGGKNIKGIQAESGAEINIEDDGTVHIYASKEEGLLRAKSLIERMFQEIEVGKIYTGKVVSITNFGAFMEVLPGKDGLIHVSELAEGRTERVEDVVKKGDVITAKCLGVDEKGRVKMSRRAVLRDEKAKAAESEIEAETAQG